ncbi:vesicle transport protein SEC20-like isoform X3 [Harmonia axyridis]|uniref:vesicle transport protein SEC20-like isoform X3 n=1 Tax=Harmonia axyridis TaxID=115357 RepID=UPI001E27601F|nr:vesicle transport protein SEC20-like isoform X3 [Harmonia axyridis]
MNSTDIVLENLRKNITEQSFQIKALIQDINDCGGPLSELHKLNSEGRIKIASLRKYIDKFWEVAEENKNANLLKEVLLHRDQLSSTMDFFKKANIKAMLQIEKDSKEKLLRRRDETGVRLRPHKRDKENLVKQSSNITEQLLAVSRQLADTTKQSADTLDSLISSSESVYGTQEELKLTGSAITQSGKLLAKYGRREFTDKILVWFAFLFFCFCVFYIVQKRLF